MLYVARYVRTEIEELDSEDAVQGQLAACDNLIDYSEDSMITDYVDERCSGGSQSRPALGHLLRDVRAGRIDVIVVANLRRLSDSDELLVDIREELTKAGVKVRAVWEHGFNLRLVL